MDPIVLATVTSAVALCGTEFLKGAASEGGKQLWGKIMKLFGWQSPPTQSELAPAIAKRLLQDQELAGQIVRVLQKEPATSAAALVASVDAEKVVIAKEINVSGDFNM